VFIHDHDGGFFPTKHHMKKPTEVLGKQRAVLLVHADWCPHCQVLVHPQGNKKTSIWDAVKDATPRVPFVEVDYETYKTLNASNANRADVAVMKTVQGFPFIAIVEKADTNGQIAVTPFQGGDRSVSKLRRFVKDTFVKKRA
jgi:thiol-disulfide isomerase/thioredoxin